MHPMLAQACNALRPPHARLGAFIAFEIDCWIASMNDLRWCELDDYPREYLGGMTMRQHVIHTIIDRFHSVRELNA